MSFPQGWIGIYDLRRQGMDAILLRRQAIAQNIANANNPNYHPVHVYFEEQLEKLYKKTPISKFEREEEFEIEPITFSFDKEFDSEDSERQKLKPVIVRDPVNRVDVNYEMQQLYKDELTFNAIAENNRPTYARDVLDVMLK